MANTSDKKRIQDAIDRFSMVPFSRAQLINEHAIMMVDIYELFDEPSREGEAMEVDCENESDYPSEYERDTFKSRGKELYHDDTQPMDYGAMIDFVADTVEYINEDGSTTIKPAKGYNIFDRRYILQDIGDDEEYHRYKEVDVNQFFECDCIICPLKLYLDRQECWTIHRKKGEGWFFPFDMRSVAYDNVFKEDINRHKMVGDIDTGVRATIDGRKTSGIFILKN